MLPDAGARSVRRRRPMSVPAFNTVAWFQVGTDAPEEARRFYGDLFGWKIAVDPDGDGYDLVSYPGADVPAGGISHEADASAGHAMFLVMVEDVDAVCAETEKHGGKVALPTVTASTGLRFAYLRDPSGNTFGVFTPAPA
ncbi:VOC family protein [Actinomadura sp. GC306]|nr:VOC family protein [Actinomadura sp. GC306]